MQNKCKLTDFSIRSLPIGYHWDETLPAFGIRIGKRTKAFVCVRDGKRTTLGHYGRITLSEARDKARRTLLDAPESSQTLGSAFDDFCTIHCRTVSPRTSDEYQTLIKRHFPHLFSRKLHELTTRDFTKVYDNLSSVPQTANHAHAAISVLLSWAHTTGRMTNHIKLSTPYKKKARSRVLTKEELARLWHSLGDDTFSRIIRILILTACRRGEATKPYRLTLLNPRHARFSQVSDCTSGSVANVSPRIRIETRRKENRL